MPMILFFGKSDTANAKGYLGAAVVLSIVMIPCFLVEAFICKETYTKELHSEEAEAAQPKRGFIGNLKELCKNDQLLSIVIMTFFGAICVTARMSLLAYYVIYVVGSYTAVSLVFTVMTVAQLIGTALIPFMTKRMGKKNYMLLLTIIMIGAFIGIYLFVGDNIPLLLVFSFLCGLCNSSGALSYGFVSDSIEYGAWKVGTRQEGLAASFLSLAVKASTALCGVMGVQMLSAVGYVANAQQTSSTTNGINFVVNIIPAICGVISLIPLFFYKLTEDRVAAIRADLDAGKTAATSDLDFAKKK